MAAAQSFCAEEMWVTTAGKVTATLTYDTGKKCKGKTVYYNASHMSESVRRSPRDRRMIIHAEWIYYPLKTSLWSVTFKSQAVGNLL